MCLQMAWILWGCVKYLLVYINVYIIANLLNKLVSSILT